MSLLNRLIKLGLTEKEAAIYLALLELGETPVAHIAKKSGLKRPTAYIVLEKLVQAGLAKEIKESIGSRFCANNPLVIGERIKRRLQLVQERKKLLPPLITHLNEMSQQNSKCPVIKLYEGFNGTSLLTDKIHDTNQVKFFGDSKTFRSIFLLPRDQISNLQTIAAIIMTGGKEDMRELDELISSFSTNTSRARISATFLVLPDDASASNTSFAINDNKLFVFNDYPDGDGIMIENRDIVSTISQIFKYVSHGAKRRGSIKNNPKSC